MGDVRARAAVERPDAFVGPDEQADVAVLVVTYNSAADIDRLLSSLRGEAVENRLRVIVADNDSADDTLAKVALHPDVVPVRTGGNLGYAGALNRAQRYAGGAGALLVLNPDLVVSPGAVRVMRQALARPGTGAVVPRIVDSDGATFPSLHPEPSWYRALGDAVFGPHLPRRPRWLSGFDYRPESYLWPHRVDWASGAALLIDAAVAHQVGPWDEQFFLYSEEIDYLRRLRATGNDVFFEPRAVVQHVQGGSGETYSLVALMAVNRVRYAEKHGAHPTATRWAVTLGEALRIAAPKHRTALRYLLDRGSWSRLPQASRAPENADRDDFPSGSVVIPAHNEAAVLARTLSGLAPLAGTGRIEVVVVCNGCVDDSPAVARGFGGVTVLELPQPSKTAALNAADAVAERWPRLYLDADIEVPERALRDLFRVLGDGAVLAARPPFVYDLHGASPVVRSYYRARRRLSATTGSLWGAGAYAMSEKGRARFDDFPALTGDDLFVDSLFDPGDIEVVDTTPVVVRTPRDLPGLMAILRRTYRGNTEMRRADNDVRPRSTTRATSLALLRSAKGPRRALDAATYAALVVVARAAARRNFTGGWERDESSRR